MYNPKISIIVPIYNVCEYLPECLKSLTDQTLKEIEIICINDGSTDKSLEIIQKYAKSDNRIVVINQKNQGVSVARNRGLAEANGEYVVFVDGDDFLESYACELIYQQFVKQKAEVAFYGLNNYYNISHQETSYLNNIMKSILKKKLEYTFENILPLQTNITNTAFNRKFLLKHRIVFPENIKTAEDGIFARLVALCHPKYCLIGETLYNYRKNREGSATNQSKTAFQTDFAAIKYMFSHPLTKKQDIKTKMLILDKFLGATLWYWDNFPEHRAAYRATLDEHYKYLYDNFSKQDLHSMPFVKRFLWLKQDKSGIFKKYERSAAKTYTKNISYKILGFIPLYAAKFYNGRFVYKILGLPVWKVRHMENNITTKYYLFGIPLLKVSKK